MSEQEFIQLLNKYTAGQVSEQEIALLEDWYAATYKNSNEAVPPAEIELAISQIWQQVAQKSGINITEPAKEDDSSTDINDGPVYPFYRRVWLGAAAAILICLVGVYFFRTSHTPAVATTLASAVNKPSADSIVNRFINLPDGSRVILHGNSTLQMAANFGKNGAREVSLIGEAYFDIKHLSRKPFIIHTGALKTTVLGTAFVIRAYPSQKNVTVTVTRGRVKVENERGVLGILTHGDQLTALAAVNPDQAKPAIIQQVSAQQVLGWAEADMHFDALPFDALARHLEKRYDVHISFKNPELGSCPITGKFNGTESLKEVLDILSQTRNATYSINGTQVIIDGKGCNN
jgi:transmembrane sensor